MAVLSNDNVNTKLYKCKCVAEIISGMFVDFSPDLFTSPVVASLLPPYSLSVFQCRSGCL